MTQARDTKRTSAKLVEHRKPEEPQRDSGFQFHSLLNLQRRAGNRAVVGLLESHGQLQTKRRSSAPVGVIQPKCTTCSPTSKCASCEEEETRVQRKRKNGSDLLSTTPHVQRAPRNGDSAPPETATEAEAAAGSGALIVEDEAATVAPGQMRKSEFLEQLRSSVCTTADEALKEAGETTEGCPYIEKWLSYYAEQEPAHIERALRRFAPEAATATNARDYIPAVSNRVRSGVTSWARTGEVPELPEELAGMLPGAGGALGVVAGMIGGAVAGIGSAIGGAVSSIGKALFKRKEGHAEATDDPQQIQGQLSGGQPLDGGAQSRMGAAFGHDFSAVRVHTDANAAGLSDSLNARAFTIGSDIAFGAGEYQPGTLIGDALIAHELAHVMQQQGGANGSSAQSKSDAGHDALEEDADLSAVGAVVSAWDGPGGALANLARNAGPRLRSGLKLQRCESCSGSEKKAEVGSDRWNVPCLLGILCEKDASVVEKLRTSTTTRSVDLIKIDEWRFKDGKWETWTRTNTLGTNDTAAHLIRMRTDRSCADAVETIFHEVHHQGQDLAVPWADREIEAYTVTEKWTIERGFPGRPELRTTDPTTGAIIPDPEAIEAHVRGYPGMATAGELVIGKTADGQTRVKRDDGSEFERAPVEGDRFRIKINYVNEKTIDPKLWVCP